MHRAHVFWDCPVAQAVRSELQVSLGRGVDLQRHHVWLLDSPSPECSGKVWMVVGLASLTAMEYGRARMWAQYRDGWRGDELVQEVSRAAQLRLWSELQDFVLFRGAGFGLEWGVRPGHPFVQTDPAGTGRLVLHMPVAVGE